MTAVLVLVILAVMWAVVLVPGWLQHRWEARPTDSIRLFHRRLWLLERTSPSLGAPRADMTPGDRGLGGAEVGRHGVIVYGGYDDHYDDGDPHPAYGEVDEYGDPLPAYGPVGRPSVGVGVGAGGHGEVGAGGAGGAVRGAEQVNGVGVDGVNGRWTDAGNADAGRRRQKFAERSPADVRWRARVPAYRRRRRVVAVLLVAATVTALPAVFIGGASSWVAQVLADALLVGYVALLVRRRRRAVEREAKVHYLAPIRAPRPAVVVLHGGAAR